ncbi:slr1079 [Synechocystis sp. PCC 6803]|uniref:Slr1079 protein n=1 Tax=Synechocystis sp. (strain ATCC 27184 / PCC 6803 / Kazusa) TaxID=1111708 RepID=P72916_SYNY3|nr:MULTISPECIES: hypothetical protein [unclassified Synechocystis]BAM50645.1 hypothetical protein BEST7613_1714 [Synechocystis sp. PCC 6803] [Bacillus subtilis BEST7613]AGF50622.1 hypothetical protein MYO_13610 [Synechocystis sp. PCC 6803]AVP88543.1 hypothetical protein C7I86_01865 [Synechocystis sp. IPPAS B-1465]MCW5242229.1 hypothetical protein [Synechocystis sp. PCC 6803]NHM00012.1 hypothetical protein [Synechocystis sp. PCC 6803]
MASFLALLPRSLTTFLYAVAALLRFYGNIDTTPIPRIPLTIFGWSFLAFTLGTAALLVNLGLEWNTGNRSRNREIETRERETRRDNLADEERNRASEEREKADRERDRADQERNRADQERKRAASRARIQNRGFVLQTRYQLAPSPEARATLIDFLSFLQEYGE